MKMFVNISCFPRLTLEKVGLAMTWYYYASETSAVILTNALWQFSSVHISRQMQMFGAFYSIWS